MFNFPANHVSHIFYTAGVTYTIILRCLHEGEDIVVQHFAAKAIENVAATHGRHCSKFATNEAAQVRFN